MAGRVGTLTWPWAFWTHEPIRLCATFATRGIAANQCISAGRDQTADTRETRYILFLLFTVVAGCFFFFSLLLGYEGLCSPRAFGRGRRTEHAVIKEVEEERGWILEEGLGR